MHKKAHFNCRHHRTAKPGLQSKDGVVGGEVHTYHVLVMMKLNARIKFIASLCIKNSKATWVLVDARILRWPNVKTSISFEPINNGFVEEVTNGDYVERK